MVTLVSGPVGLSMLGMNVGDDGMCSVSRRYLYFEEIMGRTFMISVPIGEGGNPSPSGEGKVGEMAEGHEPFWSEQDAWHIPMYCSRLRADNV
jgi:hypothetical protein